MAEHDDDLVYTCAAKILDATVNDCGVAEGKQRFESAHAAGLAGREKECGNVGFGSLVFGLSDQTRHRLELNSTTKATDPSPKTKTNYFVSAIVRKARSVYSRVICLRQFITKSVLSSGRALI